MLLRIRRLAGGRSLRVIITGGSGFIGTNLVERFLAKGWDVLNLDVAQPRNHQHAGYWQKADILDHNNIAKSISDYQPKIVLHMAARTDLDENRDIRGYSANIDGVANVIDAVRQAGSVERTLFASSRLVFEIGYRPKSEVDYKPSTLYGQSKIRGEELVRQAGESLGHWVIVRPTSIWGPWFDVPYKGFFELVANNRYLHPGQHNPRKSYGYVGNTVYQIEQIIEASLERVNGKTLWLADYPPLHLREWANEIQKAAGANPIKTAPMPLLRFAATAGDVARRIGWQYPPLTSFRLNNLVTEMVYDTSELEGIVGALPFSTEEGVELTVDWLQKHHPAGKKTD
jgi:GlcNAc-P-P-Und epimerase